MTIYPGGTESIHFPSGDGEIVGAFYVAPSDGPRPTAILLHGFPGSEKSVDIAYRLRDMGWHCLIPHFRGTWGSSGSYDITQQPDDAQASLDFVLKPSSDWAVDPDHLALIGYSLGSRAAIVAAARDARAKAVVSIAGIADFDELMLSDAFFASAAAFLQGATAEILRAQWRRLGGAENPISVIGGLKRPILIVHGSNDDLISPWMAPSLHQAAGNGAVLRPIEGADHIFTRYRAALVETVTGWLDGWYRGGRPTEPQK